MGGILIIDKSSTPSSFHENPEISKEDECRSCQAEEVDFFV